MKRLVGWSVTVAGALIGTLIFGLVTGRGLGGSLIHALQGEAQIPAAQPGTLRGDALLLMRASAEVIGTVGYCHKYVERNPQLLAAAETWNQRNLVANELIVEAVKRSGGLSAKERDDFDRAAGSMIKRKVEAQSDRAGYCRDLASFMAKGQLDLNVQPGTAEALKRIVDRK